MIDLSIVDHWIERLDNSESDTDIMHKAALKWALEHGSRSGRVAWQFARDWSGRKQLEDL